MAREKGLKRTLQPLEGICEKTAIEHQSSEYENEGNTRNSTSSDISIPLEDDTPVTDTVKRSVAVPSTMFEYIGPVKGTEMSHFKCLLGCATTYNTNGTPKYISCSNHSRFNIRRHVKSKHKAKLNQFDNESKNLNAAGEPTKKRSKSSASPQLIQNLTKNNVSGKTVSCQTDFNKQGSFNDASINPLKKTNSAKIIGSKKPVTVPSTMFQYIGPVKGTEMSLFKCLLGCLPMFNSNGTQKYISCANNSRFNLRRHVKLKHKNKLFQFNEKSRMLGSLKEDHDSNLGEQNESALFKLKQILQNAQDGCSEREKSIESPHKSLSNINDSESSANSVDTPEADKVRHSNLSAIDNSPLPFVDVTDFLQMTLDVQPSLAKEGDVLSFTSRHKKRSTSQSDSTSENRSISSNVVRRMYSSSSKEKSNCTNERVSKQLNLVKSSISTPEDQNTFQSCPEAKQTDSSSNIDIDYLHFPCAITVNQVQEDDADEPEPDKLNKPTTPLRRSSKSSQNIEKQITSKELSKTIEGRSIKDGTGFGGPLPLLKPVNHSLISALPMKEWKLLPSESTSFQDKFGTHVYWLQLIRRPKLVGSIVLWKDVYQEIEPTRIINSVPNKCEIKFLTSPQGTVITKYYKPIKLSQNINDTIENYPFAAWSPLITVSTETIHVLKLIRITGIDDPMLQLIPELIIS